MKKFEAKKLQARGLHALQLCRRPGDRAGGRRRPSRSIRKKVAEAIKSGKTFKTVIGDLAFDKKGDITRLDYVMYTWKKGADGKITYVQN